MSCDRAREVDIAGFLLDPRASEHRAFREHYPGCRECSAELAHWTQLEEALHELPEESSHPADEQLLALRRAPETLTAAQHQQLDQHLAGCAPCRNALGAATGLDLGALLAQPLGDASEAAGSGGFWSGLAERLRGLFELPAPVWAAAATAALVLALGLPWLLQEGSGPESTLAQRELREEPIWAPTPEPVPGEPDVVALIEPAESGEPAPTRPAEPVAPPGPEEPWSEEEIVRAPTPAAEAPLKPEVTAAAKAPLKPEVTAAAKAPRKPEVTAAAKAPAKPKAAQLITALGPEPIRFLPRVGLPAGRVAGGRRGGVVEAARPQALAPRSVGLTFDAQPRLYWFLPAPSQGGVHLDLSDVEAMKTVRSIEVRGPLQAGVHSVRLSRHGVSLRRERHYQWMLTAAGADAPHSGGIVRRVAPDAALRASLAKASPAERLRLLAAAGVWYDAFELLSRSIAARPSDMELRRARADLLEQEGLSAAAAGDRGGR